MSRIKFSEKFIVNCVLHRDLAEFYLRQKLARKERPEYKPSGRIPKTFHYAWFGSAKIPEDCRRCIDSWQEHHPDWEFKLWNESNFPIELYPYAQEALSAKCWAFVSDVARLHALYTEGGVYLDTDVVVLKSFEPLLKHDCFLGYEAPTQITISTFGAQRHHPYVGLLLDWYRTVHLRKVYHLTANVRFISKISRLFYGLTLNGQETVFGDGVHLYPRDRFCPKPGQDGNWLTTENTFSIHKGTGLWFG